MPSIFTRIISGEIPCYKLAENDRFISFLDVQPVAYGHALVVPKTEVNYLFDMDDELLAEINLFARDVAKKIEKVVPCKRIAIAVVGLEVPHAHIHLIPLNSMSDFSFSKERLKVSEEQMSELAKKIREA